ncbi:MAG: sulfite exporter TauE/SafE family protein [Hyphomicrobiales bacterium]
MPVASYQLASRLMPCPSLLPASLCAAPWLTAPTLAVMIAGLLVASFARGYSGFGFSALLVASWSLVAPPSLPVAVTVLLEVSASILQAAGVWRQVDWRRVGLLLAGAALGTPFGVAVLTIASPDRLRVLIAVLLLLCCGALLGGYTLKRPVGAAGQVAVGGVSGLVNGATAMGGLPVALFLAASAMAPAAMRASFIAYFFALDIVTGSLLARQGVLGSLALVTALLCLPALVAGLWLGSRHFLRASPEQFRRNTLRLLIALAVIVLLKAAL